MIEPRIAELEAQKARLIDDADRLLDKLARMELLQQQMLLALTHAEAILTYAKFTSTNKGGKGPGTTTTVARQYVRAAIAKATGDKS